MGKIGPYIGRAIAEVRQEKNFTQDDLAEVAFVTLDELKQIEAGTVQPDEETVVSIEKVLKAKDVIFSRSHHAALTIISKTA